MGNAVSTTLSAVSTKGVHYPHRVFNMKMTRTLTWEDCTCIQVAQEQIHHSLHRLQQHLRCLDIYLRSNAHTYHDRR